MHARLHQEVYLNIRGGRDQACQEIKTIFVNKSEFTATEGHFYFLREVNFNYRPFQSRHFFVNFRQHIQLQLSLVLEP